MNLEHVANIHGLVVTVHAQQKDGSVIIGPGTNPAYHMRYEWRTNKLIYRDRGTGRIQSRGKKQG